jgi:flagellar M-ring protein FliF
MDFFQKLSAVWEKVGLVQRALLIAVVLTLSIVGFLLTKWARTPDMVMLYQELAPEEAAKITDKIAGKSIPYELRNGGTSVYAPREQIYQLRLDMAKDGLPGGAQGGYKIFDEEKIGTSPFVQNVNLKRALEEELAKSILMIDGVVQCRVHIVNAERTIFTSNSTNKTASVVLRIRPGYRLSAVNIAAVTHLVAGSVEGLKTDSITVVDSQGRLLSSETDKAMTNGAGTVADYKERVEQSLEGKVEDMLAVVLGPGRASVKVSAVIDMNSSSTVTELYEPKGVATKEEIKNQVETKASADSNNAAAAPASTKKDDTTLTEFAIGKTVKQLVEMPGSITSIKVAAFVDLSSPVSADANKTGAAGGQAAPASIMQISDVEEIIKNALGLADTTGIKVVNVPFHREVEVMANEEPSKWPRYFTMAKQASLGIAAICALLVLKIFSGAKKKAGAGAAMEQLGGTEGVAGYLPAGAGAYDPSVLRKQIAGSLASNPEQVKQLFASWLEEKGE